jgi:site-specific recombinase XerD
VSKHSGKTKQFQPEMLTSTVVDQYFSILAQQGYSLSHRKRAKSVIQQFCQWLIEEKGSLRGTRRMG